MFVNNILTGIGRRLLQRLLVMFVLVVVLRTVGFFMGAEADADFRSASNEMSSDSVSSVAIEDDLWGADSSSTKSRRTDSRDEDAGWGSN